MVEFLIVAVAIPGVLIFGKLAMYLFFALWGVSIYGAVIMHKNNALNWRELWGWQAMNWQTLGPVLLRWGLASLGLLALTAFFEPERLFFLPREMPEVLIGLITFYPALSALPQEFVFCTFLFWRYAPLFGTGIGMVATSTIVFAFAHVLYWNPVAPVLSLLGGYIFATTYLKTRSLALVTLEHSLYGLSLFTIGLGYYFYSGAVGS